MGHFVVYAMLLISSKINRPRTYFKIKRGVFASTGKLGFIAANYKNSEKTDRADLNVKSSMIIRKKIISILL